MQSGDLVNFNRPASIWQKLALSLTPDPNAAFPRNAQSTAANLSNANSINNLLNQVVLKTAIRREELSSFLASRLTESAWGSNRWSSIVKPCIDSANEFCGSISKYSKNAKNLREKGELDLKETVISGTLYKRSLKYKADPAQEIKYRFSDDFNDAIVSFIPRKHLNDPDLKLVEGQTNNVGFLGFVLDKNGLKLPLLGIITSPHGERFFLKFNISGFNSLSSEPVAFFKIPNDFAADQDIGVFPLGDNEAKELNSEAKLHRFYRVCKELDSINNVKASDIKKLSFMHKKAEWLLDTQANNDKFASLRKVAHEEGAKDSTLNHLRDVHVSKVAKSFFPNCPQLAHDLIKIIPDTGLLDIYAGEFEKTKVFGLFRKITPNHRELLVPDLVLVHTAERDFDYAVKFERNINGELVITEILPIDDIESFKKNPFSFDDSKEFESNFNGRVNKRLLLAAAILGSAYSHYLETNKLDSFKPKPRPAPEIKELKENAEDNQLRRLKTFTKDYWSNGLFPQDESMMESAVHFARRFAGLPPQFNEFSKIEVGSDTKKLYQSVYEIGDQKLSCYAFLNKEFRPTGTAIIDIEGAAFPHKRILVNYEKDETRKFPQTLSIGIIDEENRVLEYTTWSSKESIKDQDLDIDQAKKIIGSVTKRKTSKPRRLIYKPSEWRRNKSLQSEAARLFVRAKAFASKQARFYNVLQFNIGKELSNLSIGKINPEKNLSFYGRVNERNRPTGLAIIEDDLLKNQFLVARYTPPVGSKNDPEIDSIMIYPRKGNQAPREFFYENSLGDKDGIDFGLVRDLVKAIKSYKSRSERVQATKFREIVSPEPKDEYYNKTYEGLNFLSTVDQEHPHMNQIWTGTRIYERYLSKPVKLGIKINENLNDSNGTKEVLAEIGLKDGKYTLLVDSPKRRLRTEETINASELAIRLNAILGKKYFQNDRARLTSSQIDGYNVLSLVVSAKGLNGYHYELPLISKVTKEDEEFLITHTIGHHRDYYPPRSETGISSIALIHKGRIFGEAQTGDVDYMRAGPESLKSKAPSPEELKFITISLEKFIAHKIEAEDKKSRILKGAVHIYSGTRNMSTLSLLVDGSFPFSKNRSLKDLNETLESLSEESQKAKILINKFKSENDLLFRTGLINGKKYFGLFDRLSAKPRLVCVVSENSEASFYKFNAISKDDSSQISYMPEIYTSIAKDNYEINDQDTIYIDKNNQDPKTDIELFNALNLIRLTYEELAGEKAYKLKKYKA